MQGILSRFQNYQHVAQEICFFWDLDINVKLFDILNRNVRSVFHESIIYYVDIYCQCIDNIMGVEQVMLSIALKLFFEVSHTLKLISGER